LVDIGNRVGRGDLAQQLHEAIGSLETSPMRVVVAGEVGRGKTGLVNALLDSDIVPPDVPGARRAQVRLTFGRPGRAFVETPGSPTRALALPDVGTVEVDDDAVAEIVIEHDHPLLAAGVELVDAPSAGGLGAGPASLAAAGLAYADALVFVADASAPLSRSELEYLAVASGRASTTLLVLARIDAFAGWQEILDRDRELVASSNAAPVTASWFAVSASLHMVGVQAARSGNDALAARAAADAHVAELAAALHDTVVERGRVLRTAALGDRCRSVLDALAEPERALLDALEGAAPTSAAEDERAAIANLAARGAAWRGELDTELRKLTLDLENETEYAFTDLHRRFETRISTDRHLVIDDLEADLEAEIAALWVNVDTFLNDRLAAIVDQLLRTLVLDGGGPALGHLVMSDRVTELVRAARPRKDARAGSAETLLQYYPVIFSGGAVATVATYASSLFSVSANPMHVAIGGLAAMGAMFGARRSTARRSSSRQDAAQLLRTALSQARTTLAREASRRLVEDRGTIEAGISEELATRRRALEDRLTQLQAIPAGSDARSKLAERTRRRLTSLDEMRRQLDDLGTSGLAPRSDQDDTTQEAVG
jgi:hypothetical protein